MPVSPLRARPALAARAGHVLFRIRNVVAPAALVAIVALTRRDDFLAPAAADVWLDAVGGVAIAVGLALRFWVMATSGVRRSGVHRRVVAPTLYFDGAYGWTRNPLYLGNATILVGLAFAFDSTWLAFGGLPIALAAIACIVVAEERVLRETFGRRYDDYCRSVPRFVPRRAPAVAWTAFDWRRALRKEHGPIFAATSTLIALLVVERHRRFGASGARGTAALVAAWLVAATLWAAVRYSKHSGQLADGAATRVVAAGVRHVA